MDFKEAGLAHWRHTLTIGRLPSCYGVVELQLETDVDVSSAIIAGATRD